MMGVRTQIRLTPEPFASILDGMFAGFSAEDFACYATSKWKSNLYNRDRMEVKKRLLALGQQLSPLLVDADGTPLFLEASVEHPAVWNHKQVEAQHIFFSRGEAARKELDRLIERHKSIASLLDDPTPQRNHIFLALSLSEEGLEAALKLHPDARIDRQNFQQLLEDHYGAEKWLDALQHLEDDFSLGFITEKSPLSQLRAQGGPNASQLQEMIRSGWSQQETSPAPLTLAVPVAKLFYIGRSISKSALLTAADPAQTAIGWAERTLGALLPLYHLMAWSRAQDRVSIRQALEQEKASQRQQGLAKLDRVRVIKGLWSGKSGTVQEIDAKGQLKISVGSLSIKVDAGEVEKVG